MLRASSPGLLCCRGLGRAPAESSGVKSLLAWRHTSHVALHPNALPVPNVGRSRNLCENRGHRSRRKSLRKQDTEEGALKDVAIVPVDSADVSLRQKSVNGEDEQAGRSGKHQQTQHVLDQMPEHGHEHVDGPPDIKASIWDVVARAELSRSSAQRIVPAELTKEEADRKRLLDRLRHSVAAEEAWDAYQSLLFSQADQDIVEKLPVHLRDLEHLSRLLARQKPRTRNLFLRLLAVLSRIQKEGGRVRLWQWNVLINCAGKGLRKTTVEDYKAAVGIFNDMMSASRSRELARHSDRVNSNGSDASKPDIVTYTTLLDIATKTKHPSAVRHAVTLLRNSGLSSNRFTHLVFARYGMELNGVPGAMAAFNALVDAGHDMGLDGVNAFLWAHAREGRFDPALTVYRALRSHMTAAALSTVTKEEGDSPDVVEGIALPKAMVPDEITYTLLIQSLAYHGYLTESFQILADMVSSHRQRPISDEGSHTPTPTLYAPSLAIYRGLFCAFARHGIMPGKYSGSSGRFFSRQSAWNLENLEVLLDAFFDSPRGFQPNQRTIYWIITAVKNVTDTDRGKLREVWHRLEQRFELQLSGRLKRLHKAYSNVENETGRS